MMAICPCCGRALTDRPAVQPIVDAVHAGPAERRLLDALVKRFGRWVPTPVLIDALYHDDADGGLLNAASMVSVLVHQMRPRLAPHGLTIEGIQHSGRRMTWRSAAA